MKIFLIILFTLLLSIISYSQKKEIGVDIGYGKSAVIYKIEKSSYYQLGFNYYTQPLKAPFAFNTGIIYDFRGNNKINFNYLKIPIGLDFVIGKKLNFIFGGGFYFSYLFFYNGTENLSNFEESKNRLQLGGKANIGFTYKISEKIVAFFICQINHDITSMYADDCASKATCPQSVKGVDGFIKLGIRYNISEL